MTSPDSDMALEAFLWIIVFVTLDIDAALSRLRKFQQEESTIAQKFRPVGLAAGTVGECD